MCMCGRPECNIVNNQSEELLARINKVVADYNTELGGGLRIDTIMRIGVYLIAGGCMQLHGGEPAAASQELVTQAAMLVRLAAQGITFTNGGNINTNVN